LQRNELASQRSAQAAQAEVKQPGLATGAQTPETGKKQ
jgi:hypothetical protein